MRLSDIKLAGFKSFVDPTHIPVPGQLVGVVGPNGCGKSNIIDAVRWVLGESKATALRGETMQDVIFNGSATRKPVGRASVELIFDNSLGKAAGQWSQYAEISIKRVLQRDGESSYYINNLHVRRRDVADIFLGTGVGGRGYAIIEQGMISRIIEAKPEELRVFLEEAAGVSKYRERRRETELRLADTRENLLRVDDIRQELEKQLQHLEQQARVATQYKDLQSQLVTAQNLLWLGRKQEAGASRARLEREIQRIENELEAETAKLRDAEKRLEEKRTRHYAASDELHQAQGQLYAVNGEVARIEQQIEHLRENRSRTEQQIATLRNQIEHHESQLESTQDSLNRWHGELARAREQHEALERKSALEAEKLPVAEQTFRACQDRLNELKQNLLLAEQSWQLEEAHRVHAERTLQQLQGRRDRLVEERDSLPHADTAALERLRDQLAAADAELREKQETLERLQRELPLSEGAKRALAQAVQVLEQQLTEVEARVNALTQLQQRLESNEKLNAWLSQRQLDKLSRLWQGIRIKDGWENALEAALRERLNAIRLETLDLARSWTDDSPPGKVTMFELEGTSAGESSQAGNEWVPLQRYLSFSDPRTAALMREWLSRIYVVESLAQAMEQRLRLAAGEMLVSREGHMVSPHSITYYAPDTQLHGVLARQREIEQLNAQAEALQRSLQEQKSRLAEAEEGHRQLETSASRLRQESSELQQKRHDLQLQVLKQTQQIEHVTQRCGQITRELEEIDGQSAAESANKQAAEAKLAAQREQIESIRQQVQVARQAAQEAEGQLDQQRQGAQNAAKEMQEAGFYEKTCVNKIGELENSIQLTRKNVAELKANLEQLEAEQTSFDEAPLRQQLQEALALRQSREQVLSAARNSLEEVAAGLQETEQERLACEQKLHPLREKLNDTRLKQQEARLTESQFIEQLQNAGAKEEELLPLLGKAKSSALQTDIARLNGEIAALGAVNLAALEELQTATERKTYLDSQAQDLREAVETLENAIRRIDRETRERLLETFEQVNRHLGEMFPMLFGGGQARLVLTGEEILDSGVQVIAQPPGKKNSTIHLLSGGEKALTALSLVFSLFQLNPAPFCLLDEVDAPLDDSNTERFCNLVKAMSRQTQFLFISHNKITMEMAQQLVGITMQEQGVSRVVAVDIEEAIRMRDEAVA